jgi:tetratricopeptide (TPR) repeat protein
MESDKSSGEVYANLGALKWQQNDKEQALRFFEKAFILSPTDENIGINYYQTVESLERAELIISDSIALYPSYSKLKYMLIDVLIEMQRYKEAMEVFEEALLTYGITDNLLKLALGIREKAGPKEVDRDKHDSISLCMIAKDEENNIARCLMSVRSLVDEVIVADTGSTDRTKDIARAFGAKVYDFTWTNNFSDARNFSLSKASGKWILVLDADEVISSVDHSFLAELIRKSGRQPVAYSFVTRNYMVSVNVGWTANDGRYEEEAGTGWFPSDKVRLFPNEERIYFENPVHEFVEPSLERAGIKIKRCHVPIHHYGRHDSESITHKTL